MTSPSSPPLQLLIVSASIGGGHVAAARALEEAARARGLEPQHVDLLSYTPLGFRRLYRQTYFDLVRTAPDFVDWLGKRLDRRPREQRTRQERVMARLTQLISRSLLKLVRSSAPDVVLHTHFLPPAILHARRLRLPQAVVITDYAAHNLWLQPGIGRYFVASDEVAAHLQAVGVEAARVRVSGIPISGRFARAPSQAAARAALGLAPERDVLLLMAAGLSAGVLRGLLEQLATLRWPLTVVIICGRSHELVGVAERETARYRPHDAAQAVHFVVHGFTEEVPRYMAAADLLVGKPGGLTTSEALAMGLPFAVVNPYPLQEEANANFLLERGVGLRLEPLTVAPFKLRRFLEDPPRRAAMRAAARALARADAADAVISSLLEEPLAP
ncbi:MGDG synthase family glycosyltransferase [Truepera radiovictrix]|uniref:MGDG synthase family glycosyltransferase n=1 Tax=Truepera radiovictrix TaxID=332249 RepID=UPI000674749C|nr:glycosyltransferase [Truepera radiovictrix]WMT58380.1 glycosyltransferase [Truepera radiovictrix]